MNKPCSKVLITAAMALCLTLAAAASPRKTVRTGPRTLHPAVAAPEADSAAVPEPFDTISPADREHIRLSGFDKTLRSRREEFFVTNQLPDTACALVSVTVELDYTDIDGRQLHRATHTLKCHIPHGQTRRMSVPSWDTQQAFYYYRNTPPRRAQGSPFKVRSTVVDAVICRDSGYSN